ncbi:centromere protein S-like [Amphiura filiformis]|uniref:centromere protein S-like n=1 Tax=Amphiura filiformis TaxID=82378 RepID=UPI003B212E09
MTESDYEEQAYIQRLKAAVHYTVGQVCEETATEMDVTFSRQVIATISEAAFKQIALFAQDLELFAQHAKRSTISSDDVKLLARRSTQLSNHMKELSDQQAATTEAEREKRKANKSKKGKAKPTED